MDREQVLQRLQSDLDRWNAQITAWEETARGAPDKLRARLRKHLDAWRDQRDLAALKLREVRLAPEAALGGVVLGADAAWRDLAHAYETARERFEASRTAWLEARARSADRGRAARSRGPAIP